MLQPQGKLPTQWHTRCTAALTVAPVPQPPCSTNTEQWGSSESSPRSLKVQAACSTAVVLDNPHAPARPAAVVS